MPIEASELAFGSIARVAGRDLAELHVELARQGDQLSLPSDDEGEPRPARARWGWLLRHVFHEDVDTCTRCAGPMRWVEAATTPDAIARLMAGHGLAPERPPRPPRAVPAIGQLRLPFGA